MHDLSSTFSIFAGTFNPEDIGQGSLGNCYLLAALASLTTNDNFNFIKNAFITQQDNANHVYVTRWMIAGKTRYVAVDDWVPAINSRPAFASPSRDGDFWVMILEKAWAKIYGSYMATKSGQVLLF